MNEDAIDKDLTEAFGDGDVPAPASNVLRALQARSSSVIGVHLDSGGPDDAPVHVTEEARALRDPSDRYQVLGEIGRGGVGVVYKGRDTDLGRDVAMKVLKDEYATRPDVLARFVEEAQIGGQLQHPGIVPVYELGLHAGERPYFAMKLVKGETLAEHLARRTDRADERRRLLGVFEQVCQTVAYAHARRVVHRDLKPANVMIGAFGEVQVVDWGFAKVLAKGGVADGEQSVDAASERSVIETVRSGSDSGSHSLPGSMMGTPAYMPPEQAQGDIVHVDRRSDVFALGAILCEILTGDPPYREADGDLVRQAANAELDGAHGRLQECDADPALITLCTECLTPARRARPESAAEVAERVGAYLTSVEERARRAELHAAEARYRHRTTLLGAVAALVIVMLGSGTWAWLQGQAQDRRAEAVQLVSGAMSDASSARGKAQANGLDPVLWDAAVTAAQQAAALASSDDVDVETRNDVAMLLDAVEVERNQAQDESERLERDEMMLERLETLRIPIDDDVRQFDWHARERHRLDVAYAAAFREYLSGSSAPSQPVEDTVAALRGDLSVELAACLDHWSLVRDGLPEGLHGIDAAGTARLRDVAQLLDPDSTWRIELRALLPEAASEGERLASLAEEIDMAELTAAGCRVLREALWQAGEKSLAVEVLRRARELHPQDFDLCFALAVHLELLDEPRWQEAVDTYRIAYALRPGHDEVLHRWSLALSKLGHYPSAERIARRLSARNLDDAHWLRHVGTAVMDQDRFDEAMEIYDRVLDLDPDDGQTYKVIGSAWASQGKDDEAIESYQQALLVEPWNSEARSNLGNALQRTGHLEEAIECYHLALEAHPDDERFLNNLGFALFERGDVELAIEQYRRALQIEPRDTLVLRNLGTALLRLGDEEEALSTFEQALAIDPQDAGVLNAFGNALSNLGRLEEAIERYEQVLATDPCDAAAHSNLGVAFVNLGQLEKGADCQRRAIDCDPKLALAHGNLGAVLCDLGQGEDALTSFQRAIDLDPRHAGFHDGLGFALALLGRTDDAIESYQRALEIDELYHSAHDHLGLALASQGKLAEAIESYERAVEIDSEVGLYHANLGVALNDIGRPEDAVACCRRAIELGFGPAHGNLGAALRVLGKYEEAIENLGRALELEPERAELHNELGVVFLQSGKLEQAVGCFRRAVELDPGSLFSYLNLSDALKQQGYLDEAIASCLRALELDPNSALAHARIGLLLAAQGKPEEAAVSNRRAIALDPNLGPPRINLGNALHGLARFEEARAAYEGAEQAFGRQQGAFAEHWAAFARKQVEWIDGLPILEEVLLGQRAAASSAEWSEAIDLGYLQQRFREVVSLTEATLNDALELVDDDSWSSYNSACVAALLAADQEAEPDAAERARLRALAHAWLTREVERWGTWLASDERAAAARESLRHALEDPDFAAVRGERLASLPEQERAAWHELWTTVEQTLQENGR